MSDIDEVRTALAEVDMELDDILVEEVEEALLIGDAFSKVVQKQDSMVESVMAVAFNPNTPIEALEKVSEEAYDDVCKRIDLDTQYLIASETIAEIELSL